MSAEMQNAFELVPWKGFSYEAPGRIAPACRQIASILSDGAWHRWADIAEMISTAHDIQVKTVCNLLHGMVKTGGIERRGEYRKSTRTVDAEDNREALLITWPQNYDTPATSSPDNGNSGMVKA